MSKAVGATDVKLVISTSNHPTLWVVRAANVISLARQDYPRKHHPSVRASKASALARPSSRVSTLNNSNLRIILILTQCTLPGLKCDRCSLGYYGLDANDPKGCRPCNCNAQRSLGPGCDQATGQCQCRENFSGFSCDTCIDHYYLLPTLQVRS